MRDAAHSGGAILLEVWEGDSGGRGGDISSDGSSDGAGRSLRRASGRGGGVRWAGAAESAHTGYALDDQRNSAAGGSRLDDHFWGRVLSVPARVERAGGVADGRMGAGRFSFARDIFGGRGAGDVRRGALGSGLGTF